MATAKQESQWVLRAQCNDREALELLLRSVQPSIHQYLRHVIGPSQADDVSQDVLIIVCRKLKWLHEPRLFRAWVYRIASRAAYHWLKQEQRSPGSPNETLIVEDLPATGVKPPEEVFQDLLPISDLPPASRAVLSLHFQQDMSLAEVAAILEIPLGTVKSRLAYGLNVLRKQLKV